eukprot:Nk52_evm5s659 gene=Nk52_evmTU5s659
MSVEPRSGSSGGEQGPYTSSDQGGASATEGESDVENAGNIAKPTLYHGMRIAEVGVKDYLERADCSHLYEKFKEEGCETMKDMLQCDDSAIDFIASRLRIKLFSKIKLKNELRLIRKLLENVKENKRLRVRIGGKKKPRERGVFLEPSLTIPREVSKRGPGMVEKFEQFIDSSTFERLGLLDIMKKEGYIKDSCVMLNPDNKEHNAILSEAQFYRTQVFWRRMEKCLINLCSAQLLFDDPEKYKQPASRLEIAKEVVAKSNFKDYATWKKEVMPKRINSAPRVGATKKELQISYLSHLIDQGDKDIERLYEVIGINQDRVELCKAHQDFKLAFEITQENDCLKKELEETKVKVRDARTRFRKRKWYEHRRQKNHLKPFNVGAAPGKLEEHYKTFRHYTIRNKEYWAKRRLPGHEGYRAMNEKAAAAKKGEVGEEDEEGNAEAEDEAEEEETTSVATN